MTSSHEATREGLRGAAAELRRRPDPRLSAYLIGGFGALLAAIPTGEPAFALVAAPFLTLLALGLARSRPIRLRGEIALDDRRAIEGDVLSGEVTVSWDGDAEVEIVLADGHGVVPLEPTPVLGWSVEALRGPVTLPFEVRATSWGVQDLGALWVRARRPGGLVVTEKKLAASPSLRVLPTPLRLGRLLRPTEPRTVAGAHPTRFRGQGTDFAELRPYRPGDRLRDLSWGTSARLGTPWVRVSHPERTGTVLLFLDVVFADTQTREALARAARAAWAVASLHLRAQDRVGLLARGRTAAWLPPRGGRRARWMLLDELLAIGQAAEDGTRRRTPRGRIDVPGDALIVAVTTLRSQVLVPDLVHYRRAGHATVALVLDNSDLLPDDPGRIAAATRRLWIAQRETERRILERGGVLTTLVTPEEGVGAAILGLRRRMNALRPQPGRVAGGVR